MMADRKPFFRFNPNAYEANRSLKASDETCLLCNQPCGWRYTGNIYAADRPAVVCACCIADGSLTRSMGEDGFSLHDIDFEDIDPGLQEELLCRTPGVACFNPYNWPVIDGMPMAFLMYGDEKSALWDKPAVREAVQSAFGDWPWDGKTPGSYVLLFRQIDGEQYRAVIDPD